jgi:hypothetical protein
MTRPERDLGQVFKINEKALQNAVVELAHLYGWLVHHTRPAQMPSGRWATPIQGDAGFPDLVLVRGPHTIFVELKSAIGRTSEAQDRWIAALQEAGQEVHIWRPKDISAIKQRLAHERN